MAASPLITTRCHLKRSTDSNVAVVIIGGIKMKTLSIFSVILCLSIPVSAAVARGGGGGVAGMHSSVGHSATGGAAGTSPTAPGTNSLGTALSSGGRGNGPQKGPLLGSNAAIDRDEPRADGATTSTCRGC